MRNGVRYQKMSNQSTTSTTTNSLDRQLACWPPSQDRIKLCHVIRSEAILVRASNPSRVLYGISYCRSRRLALFESEAYPRDRKQTPSTVCNFLHFRNGKLKNAKNNAMHIREEHGVVWFLATATERCTRKPHDLHFFHTIVVHEYSHVYVDYFNYSSTTTLTMSGATATPPPAVAGSGSTSTTPSAATSCLPTSSALHQLRCAPRVHVSRLQRLYFAYAARPDASAPPVTRRVAHHAARRRLLHLRCASGCLGTSRGSSSTSRCLAA
jgi:hypothetical protein